MLIESTDGKATWGTVGASDNIIEATWRALVDSVKVAAEQTELALPEDHDNIRGPSYYH